MSVKAAFVFHRNEDHDMGTSVDSRDRLRGSTVCLKLAILNLFRSIAGD